MKVARRALFTIPEELSVQEYDFNVSVEELKSGTKEMMKLFNKTTQNYVPETQMTRGRRKTGGPPSQKLKHKAHKRSHYRRWLTDPQTGLRIARLERRPEENQEVLKEWKCVFAQYITTCLTPLMEEAKEKKRRCSDSQKEIKWLNECFHQLFHIHQAVRCMPRIESQNCDCGRNRGIQFPEGEFQQLTFEVSTSRGIQRKSERRLVLLV
jgi:hypothetical protein